MNTLIEMTIYLKIIYELSKINNFCAIKGAKQKIHIRN